MLDEVRIWCWQISTLHPSRALMEKNPRHKIGANIHQASGNELLRKKKCKAARPGFAPMVFHDCFSKIDTSSVSAGTLRKQSIFVGPTSHPSILQAGLLIQFDIFLPPFFMAFLALLSSTVMHASGARSTRWVWVSSLNREHHISIDKRLGWTWSAPAVLSFSYSWSCHAYPFLFA